MLLAGSGRCDSQGIQVSPGARWSRDPAPEQCPDNRDGGAERHDTTRRVGGVAYPVNDILNEPDTKARFRELNLMAAGGSPQDMAKLKKEETERWTKVIRDAGIQAE